MQPLHIGDYLTETSLVKINVEGASGLVYYRCSGDSDSGAKSQQSPLSSVSVAGIVVTLWDGLMKLTCHSGVGVNPSASYA